MIEIREVRSRSDLKKFWSIPEQVYGTDSKAILPLRLHMDLLLKSQKGGRCWLAWENGKAVARIASRVHHDGFHHFGFFECLPEHHGAGVKLIQEIQKLHPEKKLRGPYHFRQEDPFVGLMVDGFEEPPYFLMSFNPKSYDETFKQAGLKPVMDLRSFRLATNIEYDPKVYRIAKRAAGRFHVRNIIGRSLKQEALILAGIFNEALKDNWGFERFEMDQINELVQMLRFFIDKRCVFIAEENGEPVGAAIFIPNYNQILQRARGRLSASVIWNMMFGRSKITEIRGYALGVLPKYRNSSLSAVLGVHAREKVVEAGYKQAEIGWVLSNNLPMLGMMEAFGYKSTKTYRIYES